MKVVTKMFLQFRKNLILIFSLLTILFLFTFCVKTNRMPLTAGDAELLFPRYSETLTWYNKEKEIFGDYLTDIIVLKKSSDFIFLLEELESSLLAIDGVQSLISPAEKLQNELFGLTAKSGDYARIILQVDGGLSSIKKEKVNIEIKATLNEVKELNPMRVGSFVTTQEVSSTVREETKRVTPLIIVSLFIVLLILLKNIKLTLIVLGTSGIGVGISILAYSAIGLPLGPLAQLAPPLLLAIATSFNIHVVTRYINTPFDKRRVLIKELRVSILLAAFTTSISLGTLYFINVTDVSRFALLSSIGIIISSLLAITIPFALLEMQIDLNNKNTFLNKLELISKNSLKKFSLLIISLSLLLGFGIFKLEIHTNPLNFLTKNNNLLKDAKNIKNIFPGSHYLSLFLSVKNKDSKIEDLSFLKRVKNQLRKLKSVKAVISPDSVIENINSNKKLEMIANLSLLGSSIPTALLSLDKKNIRLLIEISSEGKDLLQLKSDINKLIRSDNKLKDFNIGISSLELIMAEQTNKIVSGIIKSLLLTMLLIFLLLLFIFKNFFIASIGLIPNILPILSVSGFLGFFAKDLDLGSCIVASSALGIAVDNTFHFLLCYRNSYNENNDSKLAIQKTLNKIISPFVVTTIVLLISFSMMLFANSKPVESFGVLLAITLLVGLFTDLIVLPCMLLSRELKNGSDL